MCGCFVTLVGSRQSEPMCHIATREVWTLFYVWANSNTIAGETSLTHVSTPSKSVAVADGIVHHFHELVDWQVVAATPAPVVLNFDDEFLVERMVSEGRERHIVVHVQTERCLISLWSVSLSVHRESLWHYTQVGVEC